MVLFTSGVSAVAGVGGNDTKSISRGGVISWILESETFEVSKFTLVELSGLGECVLVAPCGSVCVSSSAGGSLVGVASGVAKGVEGGGFS